MSEEAILDPEYEGWMPTNDREADWCISIIEKADATLKKMKEHYEKQLKAIQEEHDTTIARMNCMLNHYLQQMQEMGVTKQTKTQISYKLPSATIKLKTGGTEYKRDQEAMLTWLKAEKMNAYIKTEVVQTAKWADLKKACKELPDGTMVYEVTGEIVPGVQAVPKPDVFIVEKE